MAEPQEDLRTLVRRTLRTLHTYHSLNHTRGPAERAVMDRTIKQLVFQFLYFCISESGSKLEYLFPNKDNYPRDIDSILLGTPSNYEFYKGWNGNTTGEAFYRHDGRNCGRKFRIGEPIYRCQECGYDDTCVLCVHCFNPSDHVGHHIYTDICGEYNSGICDCGDDEAWHQKLHCKASSTESNDNDDDDNNNGQAEIDDNDDADNVTYNEEVITTVLSEIFEYFIDVFNQSFESLPTFNKDITLKLRTLTQRNLVEERNEFLRDIRYKNPYMEDTLEPGDYTVMIYNDEYHNYSQATTALRQGVPDNIHIDILTSKIDSEGRAMLKCSKDINTLISGFFEVQTNGLSATLTSWTEYIHQEACKYIVQWLHHCLTIPNVNFQGVFRDALGKVLCSPVESLETSVLTLPIMRRYFPDKFSDDDPYACLDLSVLNEENKIPLGKHKTLADDSLNYISTVLNKQRLVTAKKYTNSRLQYILFFDNRMWKKLRKDLQNIIIPTLSSSLTYKPIFCEQLVEIFNHIIRSVTYADREPQLTALRESVVQLFTCPTNASIIFGSPREYFIDIMWSIIDIFVDFCKLENGCLIWQTIQVSNPTKSYSFSMKQGLYIVEVLLGKLTEPDIILRSKEFISIVTLCKIFGGAWKIKRKEGEHVLHEDQHFIPYLEYTTSIFCIIRTVMDRIDMFGCDQQLLLNAVKLLNSYLSSRLLTYKLVNESHEVLKFTVSKDPVAFMNPVHTFFSLLIEKASLQNTLEVVAYQDVQSTPNTSNTADDSSENHLSSVVPATFDFLKISDYSLRVVVLCSQIDVGFWVRNGMSVLHQANYYKNNPELDTYSRDIHLNQLAYLWETDDIPRVVYNMLDRWELLDWFNNKTPFDKTVYEDKVSLVVQHFIAFVYQLLTERLPFQKFESSREKKMYQLRQSIIYNLFTKPLSYSKLLRLVPDYLTEGTADFDSALKEVSVFIEPKGLADNGLFKLKDSLYPHIDPLHLLNLGNEFESSATIIKSHLTKNKKRGLADIILHPDILRPEFMDRGARTLGDFTRHAIFAKLIYKLLQVCLDCEDGTFLNELLHLIHAIFVDDEYVNGTASLPDAYLSKPICNLLASISNSKSDIFSDHIRSKATYLLRGMIRKRPDEIFESMEASFGSQYVEEYKAKYLNETVTSRESEKEGKKRLAKKRQAKLLARLNSQQSKFMKENEAQFKAECARNEEAKTADGDVDMTGEEKLADEQDFICSLCQDSASKDQFVVPAYHDFSPLFRNGDITDPDLFMRRWNGFYNDDSKISVESDTTIRCLKEDSTLGSRKVFVSCNHHIHHNCFRRYIQKKRFSSSAFICPLCQTFSNCVLLVTPTMPSELTLENFSEEVPVRGLISSLKPLSSVQSKNFHTIFEVILNENQSFDRSVHMSSSYDKNQVPTILAAHWANTISMLEIGSRLDQDPNSTLLLNKEQKFMTLKNLLLCIILLCYTYGYEDPNHMDYVTPSEEYRAPNQLFHFIVKEMLFKSVKLSDVITEAINSYFKEFVSSFVASISQESLNELWQRAMELGELADPGKASFSRDHHLSQERSLAYASVDDMIKIRKLLYTSFLQHILPTLRRSLVMLKVIHSIIRKNEDDPLVYRGINLEKEMFLPVPEDQLPISVIVDRFVSILTEHDSLGSLLGTVPFNSMDHYLWNFAHENCGVIKLANIAEYLNTYITDTKQIKLREENHHKKSASNRLDFKICLTCGVKVHLRADRHEVSRHLSKHCFRSFGAFLIPNSSEVSFFLSRPPSTIYVAAPYLNSHGESGRNAIKRGDLTTLNLQRYEHLNKLWVSNEIPGYISRVMGDEFRVSILSNGFLLAFNRDPRLRRMPPGGGATFDDLEDEDGVELFPDEDEGHDFYSDDDDDDDDGNGVRFERPGAQVRDFFQIFGDVMGGGAGGGAAAAAAAANAPFLRFLGQQLGGLNNGGLGDETEAELDQETPAADEGDSDSDNGARGAEVLDGSEPEQDANEDSEPSNTPGGLSW